MINSVSEKTDQKDGDWSYDIGDKEEKVYYKDRVVINIYAKNMPTVCPVTHEIKGETNRWEMYILTPFIDTDNTIQSPGVEIYTGERYFQIRSGIEKFEKFKNKLTEKQGY